MLTGVHIRMARAAVRWSAAHLAEMADVGISTVQRIEKADGVPSASAQNLSAIQSALESAGVTFTEYGVELRPRSEG